MRITYSEVYYQEMKRSIERAVKNMGKLINVKQLNGDGGKPTGNNERDDRFMVLVSNTK